MALPSRFGRRNVGNFSGNVVRNTRPSSLNTTMSRGNFLRTTGVGAAGVIGAGLFGSGVARADEGGYPPDKPLPQNVDFETIALFEHLTEGLTSDDEGYLYTAERLTPGQPYNKVWRVSPHDGTKEIYGYIPQSIMSYTIPPMPPPTPSPVLTPVNTLGLAFNHLGELFVAVGGGGGTTVGSVFKLVPDPNNLNGPLIPQEWITDVPGANGLAFDKNDNLWVSDGTSFKGRVWKFPPSGGSGNNQGAFQFIISPYYTRPDLGDPESGLPSVNNIPFPFRITANGLAFNRKGDTLFIADTIRGAIWKMEIDKCGNKGCPNPVLFKGPDPSLIGADGIVLDIDDNIWVSANAQNAILFVSRDGIATLIFQNNNAGPLEFPSSPVIIGKRFYTVNFDQNYGYNNPNNLGELYGLNPPSGGPNRGKISRMIDATTGNPMKLPYPGITLPIMPEYEE